MESEEKKLDPTKAPLAENTTDDRKKLEVINNLEEDIIRNDTIPETKDVAGSSGAFPVGAFDTSKD